MAIIGIGVDIVDIARFEKALTKAPRLSERLFVAAERDLPIKSLAARFAAKEAITKALGTPGNLRWQDVWIQKDLDTGAPRVQLSGDAAEKADAIGIGHWHISLSHDAGIALAQVIAES
jgi:holo-[acyl-carrier protein] synthase